MERCILVHVHFQCIRVTCCILLQCNAFHKVAFCCIQGLKHIRLHSDAFITRCILVVVHSCAFRMILHAAQGLHLVLVRYKYIRVHSCAFIYMHMHLIIYNIRIHMNVVECMLNALLRSTMHSNTFELDQLVSSEVVQILIVAAVNVIRVPWEVILVLVVLHCIVTGLDVGATYCVSWAVGGARHSAHLLN